MSVKLTERGAFPVDGVAVNEATGPTAWVTVICAVSLSEPAPFVAVRVDRVSGRRLVHVRRVLRR